MIKIFGSLFQDALTNVKLPIAAELRSITIKINQKHIRADGEWEWWYLKKSVRSIFMIIMIII